MIHLLDREQWCGPLLVTARDHLGSRPTEYPATVTGTGWDQPATVHDLDGIRRAIAADVAIITEDADRWGNPDAPNDPDTVEQWRAWLVERITDGLAECGRVTLDIIEHHRGANRARRHSTWTARAVEVVA